MRIAFDIEADALVNPSQIWLVVCKDIDKGERYVFRKKEDFIEFSQKVTLWIGHNVVEYDFPVLCSVWGMLPPDIHAVSDTLILSKLIDYPRQGHSIEDYGLEFGIPKGKFVDFSKYSQEMEDYCVRDVDICHRIYAKYSRYISNPAHLPSILLEHQFQVVVNSLHDNGFSFNTNKARTLLARVEADLAILDKDILSAFPPKLCFIREITPKVTKHGTLSKTDFRWHSNPDLSEFNGGSFCRCEWRAFNPSSHRQIIQVLNEAAWKPTDKTQTHIETDREAARLRYKPLDIRKKELIVKLTELKKTGWKVNENNLETLPSSAPLAARLLAKRILLEARRRTLVEWLNLVHLSIKVEKKSIRTIGGVKIIDDASGILSLVTDLPSKTMIAWLQSKKVNVVSANENESFLSITVTPPEKLDGSYAEGVIQLLDGMKPTGLKYTITSERIKGKFIGLGAWTHRMAHQAPNTANIPKEFDTNGKKKLLGKELRSLWQAPKGKLLVGVDAEGIQLRIFAHLINDPVLINALVNGKKEDKTDPHSHNQRVIGSICQTRDAAKRFLYALFLGAGLDKLAAILECTKEEARDALERLVTQYSGWQLLKDKSIPRDAERGWFTGLLGGPVRIPGDTVSQRKHLAMSGYLQHGEQQVVKETTIRTLDRMYREGYVGILVNVVHDEVVIEVPNDVIRAEYVSDIFCQEIKQVGIDLKLNCPLAGDGHVGLNWYEIH